MLRARPAVRSDGFAQIAAVTIGLVLVAYGLGLATWVSSSDSTTRFIDVSYGEPPYGFKATWWAEVVGRPYFNGGAWILLLGVAALSALALTIRRAVASVGALCASLTAVVWTSLAVQTLVLIDVQFGARFPTIGYLIVAGALVSLDPSRLWIWALFALAFLATAAAVVVWYLPVNADDSACSLATRNRYDNQGACADTVALLMRCFVGLIVAATVLVASGAAVAMKRRNLRGRRQPVTGN